MAQSGDDSASEVAFTAARCGSDTLRLEPEWPTILQWMCHFGRVTARTENRFASVSAPGRFARPSISGRRAFLGGDFALAYRLDRWKSIFATIDDAGGRELRLFDDRGASIGRVMVDDPAGRSPFDEMVWRLHARDQSTFESIDHARGCTTIDRERTLRDGQLRARTIPVGFVRALLASVGERRGQITCALANDGAVHAHAGRLERFEGVARWTASFFSRATLTIDAAAIARAWIVRAPGDAEDAGAIELFGRAGESIVAFRGAGLLAPLGPIGSYAGT